MRPRRRSSLPRFARPGHDDNGEASSVRFQWHRRYTYYLALFLFLTWFLYPRHKPALDKNVIDWSNYAYSLYATDGATLCHAVMIFDALARYGSKADRVLFYPKSWDTVVSSSKDRDSQLLVLARDRYKVKLQPVKLLAAMGRTKDAWTGTWDNSVTKFMAWSLAYYERVIALDSDMTLLQSLDELFLLPQTPIAMPRAYWCETKPCPLTSMLMVIKPDLTEFERFKDTITGGGNDMLVNAHRFDMEIINERFEHSAMVLPHRPYGLLSGEFRSKDHSAYLGNTHENWDAAQVLKEAKLVHFSDWPLPKPWVMWPFGGLQEMQPDCGGSHEGSCPERRIWKGLYEDFRERRKDICKLLSVPAPDWGVITGSRKHVLNGTVADSSSDRGSGPAVGEREAVPPSPSLSLASPAPETRRDVPAAAGARAAAAEEAEA